MHIKIMVPMLSIVILAGCALPLRDREVIVSGVKTDVDDWRHYTVRRYGEFDPPDVCTIGSSGWWMVSRGSVTREEDCYSDVEVEETTILPATEISEPL